MSITIMGQLDEITVRVDRDQERPVITLTLRDDTKDAVRFTCSYEHDNLSELVTTLRAAADNAAEQLADWVDVPDSSDGYVGVDRDGYTAVLEPGFRSSTEVTGLHDRTLAVIKLAELMAAKGYFPNAWIEGEHGPSTAPLDDEVRAFHDEGGSGMIDFSEGGTIALLPDGATVDVNRRYQTGPFTWEHAWAEATVDRDYGAHGVAVTYDWDDDGIYLVARNEVRRAATCVNCDDRIFEDDDGAGGTVWCHDHGSTVCHDDPAGSVADGPTATPPKENE